MRTAADQSGLVDRLAATIRARILSGEIVSGERLRQESLATEFGVSRTPVREALRQLQSGGLVIVQPNRGAIVHGPSPGEIRDAYAVRAELEGFAAELAVMHIHDGELDRLREAEAHFRHSLESVIEQRRTGDATEPWSSESEWERANNVFHQVIQEAAGNGQLLAAIAHLHRSFPRHLTWSALSRSSHSLEVNIEEHHRILEAIEQRDPGAARIEMAAHVRSAGELVARLLEQR